MLEPTHWWTEQLHAFTHSALLLILPLCLLVSHTVLVLCDIKHRGWIWKPSCLHIMPAKIVQLCRRGGGGIWGITPKWIMGEAFILTCKVPTITGSRLKGSHCTTQRIPPDLGKLSPPGPTRLLWFASRQKLHWLPCHIELGCPPHALPHLTGLPIPALPHLTGLPTPSPPSSNFSL